MSNFDDKLFLIGIEEIEKHFSVLNNILLITGLGFDPRTCRIAKSLTSVTNGLDVLLINYDEKGVVNEDKNQAKSLENYQMMKDICRNNSFRSIDIPLYKRDGMKKTMIFSERIREKLTLEEISRYEYIVVDISAMPRGVAFCVVKRLLEVKKKQQKMAVTVCENSKYDDSIVPVIIEDSAEYLPGFQTFSMSLEQEENETVWFPVLGLENQKALEIISDYLKPIEICPVVPFPSQDVRRGEKMIRACGDTLFRDRNVEKRNIIYVPENDPRLVYRKLYDTIQYYEKAFGIDESHVTKYAFSSQSSKLIDIGVLLAMINLNAEKIKAGIVVVDNQGYTLHDEYCEANDSLYCLCLDEDVFEW